jgi:Dockerin type I domain
MLRNSLVHSRSRVFARLLLCSTAASLVLLGFAATRLSDAPYQRPGRTERISFASTVEANGDSVRPSVSADGRFVAFESAANNLVPGDTNDKSDVFVVDRKTGTITRVSVAADGTEANDASFYGSISQDGRFVSFTSVASNLIPGVVGQQIYEKDLQTGAIELVSRSSSGTPGDDVSLFSSASADGRYVAFDSAASNLVAGDTNASYDAFVFDRIQHTTERVSVSSTGAQANGLSGNPTVSADGRFVAFWSYASNLVPNDMNNTQDVFVRDRQTGTTERVSIASDGSEANALSYAPFISNDGNIVAFQSLASNLVPNDFNGSADAFVRDRAAGTTERVSLTSDGGEASAFLETAMSADARFILFQSADPRLITGGSPGALNVVVHDRLTGVTEPYSLTNTGDFQNGYSAFGKISAADGRYMVFDSLSTNLVDGDLGGFWDVLLRDHGSPLGVGDFSVSAQQNNLTVTGWATFSGGPVAAADDPQGDAVTGAAPLGADISHALLIFRPERADLFFRLDVSQLPGFREPAPVCAITLNGCVGSASGAPGIFYALQLQSGGVPYEIRIIRQQDTSVPSQSAGAYALYRCDTSPCTKVADLSGGYGTATNALIASVPLSLIGADEGSALSGLRAVSAAGVSDVALSVVLDDVVLPDVVLPTRRVELGAAPAAIPESQVSFDTPATLSNGNFSGMIDIGSLAGGDYNVWARACLGDTCGPAASQLLSVTPPLQLVGAVSRKTHGSAGTFDVNLPLTGNPGIECRSGGANDDYTLIFTFANPLTSVTGAGITSNDSMATADAPVISGQTATVNLHHVTNVQVITVSLSNVTDSVGDFSPTVAVSMGVLLGDVNGDGQVDSSDLIKVKQQTLQPVNGDPGTSNFREDVNVDGNIDSSDLIITKRQTLTGLP